MSALSDYWAALKTILAATWPEVPAKCLFMDTTIERKNWVNLLNSGQMSTPWVVVKIQRAPTDAWGAGPKQIYTTTVWYNVGITVAAGLSESPTVMIDGKLDALKTALFASQTLGTVTDDVTFDTTSENPVNMSFLAVTPEYQGGSITFECVVYVGS